MIKLNPPLLEVTGALSEHARAGHFTFGNDTAVVAVQHMLWQTVDLFQAIAALGVFPQNIFALGKVYSNNAAVIASLRNRGIIVLDSTRPAPGQFDTYFRQDVLRLWQLAAGTLATRGIKRI